MKLELRELIRSASIDMPAIAKYLDGLTGAERIHQTRTLGGNDQSRLFDAAKGFGTVTISSLVPQSVPAMSGVAHEGKNSLLAFTHFAKVFYRPDDATASKELWGYNRTAAFITVAVGPGYYVAYDHGGGEVLVDYLRLPPKPIPGGPAILPNDARLSRVVYNGTQDVLRAVSKHVTIGRATRGGKDMNNWFVLCRDLE